MIEEGKVYYFEERGIVRHYIEAIVLFGLLIVGIRFIISGYNEYGIELFTLKDYNIFKFLFLSYGVIFILWLFYGSWMLCDHGIITKETVIGLNSYRVKRGEIRFDEIVEIKDYGIATCAIEIRDIKGNKLVMTCVIQPTEEFFNEIIKRAVNCKRVRFRKSKLELYPGLMQKGEDENVKDG